jgi:hypothetical protein
MSVEQSVEWELTGETEVLGGNLPQCNFVHHKFHMTWPGIKSISEVKYVGQEFERATTALIRALVLYLTFATYVICIINFNDVLEGAWSWPLTT